MKTTLPIVNGVALLITVFVNYFTNTGIFDGNTMSTISAKYDNFFTPAGYAFSIWGVIYLGLLGFVIYTGRSSFKNAQAHPILLKIGSLFVLSCAANSFWVIAWLNDYTGFSVLIMVALLIVLLRIIVVTRMELDPHPWKHYLFIFWPFAIYAGWVSVALIANMAAWLTKIGWDGWGISPLNWTVIMIAVAALINIFVIVTRNLREYALVGIWALIAISVANNTDDGAVTIVHACYIAAAVLLIFIIWNALRNRGLYVKRRPRD